MADPGISSSSSSSSSSNMSASQPPIETPHFALLDFLVPGFSVFSGAIHAYLGVDLNLYIPLIALVGGAIVAWRYFHEYFWGLMEHYLMSSVRISADDEIFNMIMGWIVQQRFSKSSRRFMVNTNINSRSWYLWRYRDSDDDDDEVDPESPDSKKKALQYTPSFGSHFFFYKGHPIMFERHENREQMGFLTTSEREHLSLSCFGRSPQILKELLAEARLMYIKKDEHKTPIYRGSSGGMNADPTWQRCMSRSSRPFDTVILNEKVKKGLIEDVADYLRPSTRRWYSNRGIPYRRGYLLYGPPGTGKSSLSLAVAGYFRMRIYIVSLSSLAATEENLSTLFNDLPRRCVVLLEDIDTAGLTHTREDDATQPAVVTTNGQATTPTQQIIKTAKPAVPEGRLSLSGLLNILDGVASQEGRILIMTTNHVEKLDKALIRPGRVDMMVKFTHSDAEMTASIFRAIYTPYEDEVAPGTAAVADKDTSKDTPENAEKAAAESAKKLEQAKQRVNELAKDFAARIPELEFSPAEIQGLLLRNKRDPESVMDQIEDWIVQTRKDRKEKEIKDAEKRRKEEEKARKKAAKKQKRKERKRRGGKKSRKNDSSDSDGSDSDSGSGSGSGSSSESEAEEKKQSSKKSGGRKHAAKKDTSVEEEKKKTEPENASAADKKDEKEEQKPIESDTKNGDAEEDVAATQVPEKADEEQFEVVDGESEKKGKKSPSDSGYDD